MVFHRVDMVFGLCKFGIACFNGFRSYCRRICRTPPDSYTRPQGLQPTSSKSKRERVFNILSFEFSFELLPRQLTTLNHPKPETLKPKALKP